MYVIEKCGITLARKQKTSPRHIPLDPEKLTLSHTRLWCSHRVVLNRCCAGRQLASFQQQDVDIDTTRHVCEQFQRAPEQRTWCTCVRSHWTKPHIYFGMRVKYIQLKGSVDIACRCHICHRAPLSLAYLGTGQINTRYPGARSGSWWPSCRLLP